MAIASQPASISSGSSLTFCFVYASLISINRITPPGGIPHILESTGHCPAINYPREIAIERPACYLVTELIV